jgi:hypothetical protein
MKLCQFCRLADKKMALNTAEIIHLRAPAAAWHLAPIHSMHCIQIENRYGREVRVYAL